MTEEIPVIFLTGKTDAEDIMLGFEIGAVDYLPKPFNQKELLIKVKTQLELKLAKDKIDMLKIELRSHLPQEIYNNFFP